MVLLEDEEWDVEEDEGEDDGEEEGGDDEGEEGEKSIGEGVVSSSVEGWSFTEDEWSEVVSSLSAVKVV